jgi:hypothetical protein
MTRGDGVGLEVSGTVVRGVRLAHDEPGRIVAAGEAPIARPDDDGEVLDALVRVHAQLGDPDATSRIAWFPAGATMQRIDVTGRTGPELNALRHDLATADGITSTMLVEVDARRWMLALRWDHARSERLEFLAERAGFVDATVEPAPVALGRALVRGTPVARRDAAEHHSWAVVFDTGTPIAASTVPSAAREYPGLSISSGLTGVHRLDEVLTASELGDVVDELTAHALDADVSASTSAVTVAGAPYPMLPAHDLRAPGRVAIALGAAVGAAGLAGRSRPVDVLAPATVRDEDRPRPWAIERVSDAPPPATLEPSRRRRLPRLRRRAS